jgi:ABC-type sulfate transport system substrate-binding protein
MPLHCCRRDEHPRPCAPQVVLANPKTAGVARWIFLALWGHKMKKGDASALEYVTKVRLAGQAQVSRLR